MSKSSTRPREDVDSFLLLKKGTNALEERPKCREAAGRMPELIAEIANYICNVASLGIKGAIGSCCPLFVADVPEDTLVTHEYQERVHDSRTGSRKRDKISATVYK